MEQPLRWLILKLELKKESKYKVELLFLLKVKGHSQKVGELFVAYSWWEVHRRCEQIAFCAAMSNG